MTTVYEHLDAWVDRSNRRVKSLRHGLVNAEEEARTRREKFRAIMAAIDDARTIEYGTALERSERGLYRG